MLIHNNDGEIIGLRRHNFRLARDSPATAQTPVRGPVRFTIITNLHTPNNGLEVPSTDESTGQVGARPSAPTGLGSTAPVTRAGGFHGKAPKSSTVIARQ
jgi:hypothetical protein